MAKDAADAATTRRGQVVAATALRAEMRKAPASERAKAV